MKCHPIFVFGCCPWGLGEWAPRLFRLPCGWGTTLRNLFFHGGEGLPHACGDVFAMAVPEGRVIALCRDDVFD